MRAYIAVGDIVDIYFEHNQAILNAEILEIPALGLGGEWVVRHSPFNTTDTIISHIYMFAKIDKIVPPVEEGV